MLDHDGRRLRQRGGQSPARCPGRAGCCTKAPCRAVAGPRRDSPPPQRRGDRGRLLVRILAVAQHRFAMQARAGSRREIGTASSVASKVVGDGPVVAGRAGEAARRPVCRRSSSVVPPWSSTCSRISAYCSGAVATATKAMVLGRRADQRRPADVDLLDRLFDGHVRPGDRRLERIEIHHHQLERHDAVLGERLRCRRAGRGGRGCRRGSSDAAS